MVRVDFRKNNLERGKMAVVFSRFSPSISHFSNVVEKLPILSSLEKRKRKLACSSPSKKKLTDRCLRPGRRRWSRQSWQEPRRPNLKQRLASFFLCGLGRRVFENYFSSFFLFSFLQLSFNFALARHEGGGEWTPYSGIIFTGIVLSASPINLGA